MKSITKIMIICGYAAPYKGNFIASLERLHEKLNEEKYQITYFFPNSKYKAYLDWMSKFKQEKEVVLLDNLLDGYKYIYDYDVVYIHFLGTLTFFKWAKKNKSVLFIKHEHNEPQNKLKNFCIRVFSLLMGIRKNTSIIGVSETVTKRCRGRVKKRNLITIENCIDFSRFTNNVLTIDSVPAQKKEQLTIFGFDYYRKGVDVLGKALRILQKERGFINLKTTVINSSNLIKNESLFKMQFPDVSGVIFSPSNEDVVKVFQNTGVFLSPSREEGFAYSIVEAAYFGLPVIFSDLPAQIHPPIIKTTFRVGNSIDLANKIQYVINNYHTESKNIIILRQEIELKYGISGWVEKVADFIKLQLSTFG